MHGPGGEAVMVTSPPMQTRRSVSAIFFVNGVVLASWVAHIPRRQGQLPGWPPRRGR